MAEKSEKATPKKLRDAKKKGQVAKSQDLPSAFTFIASISLVLGMSGYLFTKLTTFITNAFGLVSQPNLELTLPVIFREAILTIFTTVIPILGLVAFTGIVINFLAVGPVFATEVFKFDIKKFDPVQNLKAKFKLKTLFELCKSLLKISVAAFLIYGVMYSSLPVLIKTIDMPMSSAIFVLYAFLLDVVIRVGIWFILVAVLDFAYQKYNFANEMKMEKFEVKQEYKNTEGDPQIKSKRRQVAQEIAYSDGPTAAVKRAQAVVTNPTHLAIALGYNKEVDAAPYVLALASDELADRVIKAAKKHNVPIVRNIRLARLLWEQGEEFEFVPEASFEAVAEIIRWVSALGTEIEFDYNSDANISEI